MLFCGGISTPKAEYISVHRHRYEYSRIIGPGDVNMKLKEYIGNLNKILGSQNRLKEDYTPKKGVSVEKQISREV